MTIVEVLVAAAIIGIGLVALMVTVPISTYGLQQGKQQSTATFLAEQRMEQIRNATWQLITPGPELDCLGVGPNAPPTSNNCTRTNPTPCNSGAACTTFADEPNVTGYTGYGRTVRIVDCGAIGCAGITDAGMRLATVSVSYTPLTGSGVSTTAQNVTVSMLIAKRQ
jgi:type II secretory pathway pseudopilin PulG